jgi:hypothetical protein
MECICDGDNNPGPHFSYDRSAEIQLYYSKWEPCLIILALRVFLLYAYGKGIGNTLALCWLILGVGNVGWNQPLDKAANALALATSPVVRALVDPEGAMRDIRDLDKVLVIPPSSFLYIPLSPCTWVLGISSVSRLGSWALAIRRGDGCGR